LEFSKIFNKGFGRIKAGWARTTETVDSALDPPSLVESALKSALKSDSESDSKSALTWNPPLNPTLYIRPQGTESNLKVESDLKSAL
jgi:hypothetical protein